MTDDCKKLEEVDIKDETYYYFDDLIYIEEFDFDNTLLNKISHKEYYINYLAYKIPYRVKLLRIIFHKIN